MSTEWWDKTPRPEYFLRIYFTLAVNTWVQYRIRDAKEFVEGVNTMRSQGMLITPTTYIPKEVIAMCVLVDAEGKFITQLDGPMVTPPAPNAPTTETPQ